LASHENNTPERVLVPARWTAHTRERRGGDERTVFEDE